MHLIRKHLGAASVFALGLVLAACGSGNSNSSSNNINGNWSATLTNADGSPALAFTTSLSQDSLNAVVTGTNLSFTSSSPCFASGATETGGFTLSGTTNGVTSGQFQLIISSTPAPGSTNQLTLNGTVTNGNAVTGTWSLTGVQSGCTGSGTFTMTKM
jgi:hypothetical protein